MKITFDQTTHTYRNEENVEFTSVTKLLSRYKQPFDQQQVALKASRNKKGKWYGFKPEEIVDIWRRESERSIQLGNWYHDQREKDLLEYKSLSYNSTTLNIYPSIFDDAGNKVSTDQKLEEGVYPEFLVYLPSVGIAGQSDRITIANGKVDVLDYKTNKEIKTQSFRNYEGISQKMLYPLSHLDDCNLNHYTIQLSIYMYIILKHNPQYEPGELTLQHIIFEEDFDRDPYGYPIYLRDERTGDYIVKEVIPYTVPYLKDEVISLLEHYKSTTNG